MCDNRQPAACDSNGGMQSATPSPARRVALQQFEVAYDAWCAAAQALARAEYQLWTETLAPGDAGHLEQLHGQVVQLRDATRAAYARLLPLLSEED